MNNEQELYNRIVEANSEYRNGTPVMTDSEYDKLVEELRAINPDHDWFKSIEPGMNLEERKVSLPFPMRSLDKVKTFDELRSWFAKVGLTENDVVTITPKYDGISLLCHESDMMTYSRGGNENEGMNCKPHMKLMTHVLHSNRDIYTFGEAIIPKEVWNERFKGKINPLNDQPYKSARNTVAGLFRRDNPPAELMQAVRFVRYGVFKADREYNTYQEMLKDLYEEYMGTSRHSSAHIQHITEDDLERLFDMWSYEYNIDGLVIYIDDMKKWEQVGRHQSTGNPQWAIAYKPEEFTCAEVTTVKSVNCKVAKSGYLKPTVAVDAVELEGATIDNPTGYNARFCIENGIGEGAEIKIIRSGMVIPKIVSVLKEVTAFDASKAFLYCPSCGTKTKWNLTETDKYCPNEHCKGIALAKLVYFCEKIGYDDVGESLLKTIVGRGIKTPKAFVRVSLQDLLQVNGLGYTTASKIISRNQEILTKGVSIYKLIEASDIFEGIGEKKAKILLSNVDIDIQKKWVNGEMNLGEFLSIAHIVSNTKGVGKKTIDEFINHEREFVKWLGDIGIPVLFEEECSFQGHLNGIRVCFTGVRDKELENDIIKAGGEVVSSVSKNTTYLIVDDKNSSSSKAKKAVELGKTIISIDEARKFLSL